MDIISLLCDHHVIVVENEFSEAIGYLTLSVFLQSVFHAYRYLHAYFDTILAATDASISVIDENRRVAVWTHGAENIFSIKKNEIIGAVALETDMTTQIKLHHRLLDKKYQMIDTTITAENRKHHSFSDIIGSSRKIQQTLDMVSKISSTKATVLILGESGVGKELFAKAVHESREDHQSPFIAINCGAISASLFESELFGYERGAFSGADQKGKKGEN